MNNITNYLSSSIDWCEANFVYNFYIAEYWNSLTSLMISVNGLVGMYYYPEVQILYLTLIPIGITSFYFHASLSLMGQLLDEFFIMFSIIVSAHYINNHIYPICNSYLLYFINFIQILLCFTFPVYNRLLLFLHGFYFWKFLRHMKTTLYVEDIYYITVSEVLFSLSVACWLIDYIFCIKFINFHAIWHILIGCVGYYLIKALYIINYCQRLKY